MNNDSNRARQQRQLRAKAEAQLTRAETSADGLLHELQVHEIELAMQNEELRCAHAALEASRDRYVDLYEFAPIAYLTLSADGEIDEINLTGAALLGVARKQLINRRFARYVADQDKDRWYRLFLDMMSGPVEEKRCFELLLKRDDGTTFHAHFNGLRRNDETSPMLRIALTDITERKLIEAQLRIAAIAFESQGSMMVTDAQHVILKVNQAFTKTTGYTAEEVIGRTPRMLQSGQHDEDFYARMRDSLFRDGVWQGEIWDRRKNGEIFPLWLIINAVQDDKGTVTHYVSSQIDITTQKAAEETIKHLAFYDPLTELPNRRLLLDRLNRALASSARHGMEGALLFLDLDNFKTLNDTLGHDIGDMLLQQVAQRLVTCVREGDTVARLGGDEFVVILEELSENPIEAASQAKIVVEKILAAFLPPYRLKDHEHHTTTSIGITLFNDHQHSADELLKWADIAMYQAKTEGRNRLRFFDRNMQTMLEARAELERNLRHALAENQFRLYYQIQMAPRGHAVGAEVLIRWQHPERGLILPQDFIPLAEETGLILPIGQWVLETACLQLQKWAKTPYARHLQLAVNVSARQFRQVDFVEQVLSVVEKFAVVPSKLKLELTETVVLDDISDTIFKMNALRKIGVHFSMDDFGTGYSSLSYLTRLPLDQLKIDQSFVHNIGIKPSDAAIVQAIIAMTKALDIEVIAEGVETEEQRAFLEQHGCPLFQGYLFSKPMPLEAFEQLLQ